ncbi:MAG: anion permease [Bdellovibrio sp.]|nr:anion permease [Bdellovibrio sp.]
MFSSEYISIYITLIIILIGIFLFVKEYFTIDTSSIIIMTLFIVTGILDYKEGLSGFTNSAPITIACMMVMSYAVLNSGLLKGFRDILVKIGKKNYALTLVVFCLVTAAFSAFINDSAVVAIMIPIVLQVSSKSNISASKLLLPVSFAAAMGGAGRSARGGRRIAQAHGSGGAGREALNRIRVRFVQHQTTTNG